MFMMTMMMMHTDLNVLNDGYGVIR